MFRRVTILIALMGVCFASFAPVALADDASLYEYCVLYGGNMSDADAHRFSGNLYYHGTNGTWWGQTQWSLASDERDVNHWDLTNGYPGVDPYRYGNMSDLIYFQGMATRTACSSTIRCPLTLRSVSWIWASRPALGSPSQTTLARRNSCS